LEEFVNFVLGLFFCGLMFVALPRTLMSKGGFVENFILIAKYTILLPFTIVRGIYRKFLHHISVGKIFFALAVLGINFLMLFDVLTEKYLIPIQSVLTFYILVFVALGIYLTMIEDYKWRLEVKKAVLTFVITIIVGMVVNAYLDIGVKESLRHDLYERLFTTLNVIYWAFTDISMFFICLNTQKYFDFMKNVAKPDTLRNHVPSIAKSVLCTVIASSLIYIFFGSIATTSVGGAVVGGLTYLVFGNISPRA
jgi:hypothetical protein